MTFYNTHHHELKITYLSLSLSHAHTTNVYQKNSKFSFFPIKKYHPLFFALIWLVNWGAHTIEQTGRKKFLLVKPSASLSILTNKKLDGVMTKGCIVSFVLVLDT